MNHYLLVAAGGAIGSCTRYWLGGAVSNLTHGRFPYGTLLINVLGSLIIGFFLTLALERFSWSAEVRVFFTIGVLGGFTTFSTFSYETISLLRSSAYLLGSVNVIASILGGLLACFAGVKLASLI
jgi:CrcB protein